MQKSMLFSQPQISDFYFSLYRDFEKIYRNAAQLECLTSLQLWYAAHWYKKANKYNLFS